MEVNGVAPTTPPSTTSPIPAVNTRAFAPVMVLVAPLKVMFPTPVFVEIVRSAPRVVGPVMVTLLLVVDKLPLSVTPPIALYACVPEVVTALIAIVLPVTSIEVSGVLPIMPLAWNAPAPASAVSA